MNSQTPTPYIGPRTFLETESDRFFGRETETRDLLALVVSERLVVFYAQSGAGKSSLVNTCLIPDLRKRSYEIFTGRVAGDAPTGIKPDNVFTFNLLRSLAIKERNAASLASQTIGEFLQQRSGSKAANADEDLLSNVLIIDQFEEIFSTHHEEWEKREGFFKQLAQALEDDPYLSIVLVMREDYIASLDPYSHLVPSRFRRRYYMQRLEREAALEAIKKPVEKIRPYDDGVAERLVNDLSGIKIQRADETTEIQPGQFVEAVQLQLVCFKLWKGLSAGDRITFQDLDKLGHVDLALEEHYAERVREVAERKKVSERLIREWFGKKLITPGGTRNMVLRNLRKVGGELPDDVIQALQSDLVRAEQRGASAFYELTHDRLVEPIIANNKKWFDNLSPLQRQAALWYDQGRNETWLFGDQALAEVEAWAAEHQDELTPIEIEFLEECRTKQREKEERLEFATQQQKSRQRRTITNLLIIAALVTSGLAVFGIVQASKANTNAQAAQTARIRADNNAITAQAIALTSQAVADEAQKQSGIARAGELAAQSQRLLTTNLQNSLLLAVEAFDMADTLQSRTALLDAAVASPQLLQFLPPGHTETVTSVAFSPDGKILASGSADDNILLWDMDTSQLIGQLPGHKDDVSSLAFSPDGKILASGSADATIALWDVEELQRIAHLKEHTSYVSSVAFSPDGKILASGGYDNTIIFWDVETGQLLDQLKEQSSYVSSIAFSPDGSILASAGGDQAINVWSVDSFRLIGRLPIEISSVSSVAISPDSQILASANSDYTISLWDLNSLEPIGVLEGHTSFINSIAFKPDSRILASGSYDNTIILWNVESLQSIGKLPGTSGFVSVAFSHDGRMLASGGYDTTIHLWDIERSNPISQPLPGNASFVTSVAFSPDGKILASGSDDNIIHLWDMNTRQIMARLAGHTDVISSIAFSPDGRILASGSGDRTVQLWDMETHRRLGQLTEYEDYVTSVAFNPDGESLAASS
ncbi:MAG TPA: hypothetical protein VMJ90_10950, partial [Anaerolineales bacterium]|nr:hypothetical protein [Anaerolineales bacterium]